MDAITLALAKQYTNSQRLAFDGVDKEWLYTLPIGIQFSANADYENLPIWVVYRGHVVEEVALFVKSTDLAVTVKWDGVDYYYERDFSMNGAFYAGNASLGQLGDNTGEPFLVIFDFDNEQALWIAETYGDHYINLERHYETIHPIDQKYIPPLDSITLNGADGKQYKVAVDETGTLTATAIE